MFQLSGLAFQGSHRRLILLVKYWLLSIVRSSSLVFWFYRQRLELFSPGVESFPNTKLPVFPSRTMLRAPLMIDLYLVLRDSSYFVCLSQWCFVKALGKWRDAYSGPEMSERVLWKSCCPTRGTSVDTFHRASTELPPGHSSFAIHLISSGVSSPLKSE